MRGDVKVFDFGLCKSLSGKLKARDGGYGYRLTGKAGSLPYMAPEVCIFIRVGWLAVLSSSLPHRVLPALSSTLTGCGKWL